MVDRRDSGTIRYLLEALASEALVRSRRNQDHYGLGIPPPQPRHHPFDPDGFAFQQQGERLHSTFIGIFPLLRKIFYYFVVSVLLLISSLGLYALFYYLVMPSLHASEKLYFDYTGMARHPAPVPPPAVYEALSESTKEAATIPEPTDVLQNLTNTSDTTTATRLPVAPSPSSSSRRTRKEEEQDLKKKLLLEKSPWAVADLFSQQSCWEAHHPDILPPPKTRTRILPSGKPHFIEVLLDLPESDLNRRMGMFGVLVELQSSNGTMLASSMRTARIPHESFWISVVRKAICIVPLMLGALQESRRVLVPSFRFYVESEKLPLQFVTVRLIMGSEKVHRGEFLEVLEGALHIGKELTEFQLLLREWFFTCLTFGTLFFFGLQLVLIFGLRWYWECKRKQQRHERIILEDDASDNFGLDGVSVTGESAASLGREARRQAHDGGDSESWSSDDRGHQEYDRNLDEGQDGEWEDLPPQTGSASLVNDESTRTSRTTIDPSTVVEEVPESERTPHSRGTTIIPNDQGENPEIA
mmetsp:Transcript_13825/g.22226  ORF Transcript_13825/g.22226 Transcript_13825/m.22226 type:complete len:528 (-) Transcript_13825:3106-4689(-)